MTTQERDDHTGERSPHSDSVGVAIEPVPSSCVQAVWTRLPGACAARGCPDPRARRRASTARNIGAGGPLRVHALQAAGVRDGGVEELPAAAQALAGAHVEGPDVAVVAVAAPARGRRRPARRRPARRARRLSSRPAGARVQQHRASGRAVAGVPAAARGDRDERARRDRVAGQQRAAGAGQPRLAGARNRVRGRDHPRARERRQGASRRAGYRTGTCAARG